MKSELDINKDIKIFDCRDLPKKSQDLLLLDSIFCGDMFGIKIYSNPNVGDNNICIFNTYKGNG